MVLGGGGGGFETLHMSKGALSLSSGLLKHSELRLSFHARWVQQEKKLAVDKVKLLTAMMSSLILNQGWRAAKPEEGTPAIKLQLERNLWPSDEQNSSR